MEFFLKTKARRDKLLILNHENQRLLMESILPYTYLLIAAFWAILFLQSGLDKVFDWKGNLSFMQESFADSPLAGLIPALLGVLTLVEVTAGVLCAIGLVQLLLADDLTFLRYGVLLATAALIMLFFGQRINKEYAGAATIAMYFGVALVSLLLLS